MEQNHGFFFSLFTIIVSQSIVWLHFGQNKMFTIEETEKTHAANDANIIDFSIHSFLLTLGIRNRQICSIVYTQKSFKYRKWRKFWRQTIVSVAESQIRFMATKNIDDTWCLFTRCNFDCIFKWMHIVEYFSCMQ